MGIVLPHRSQVLGTENQRFQHLIIRHDTGDGGGHAGFPKTHHVTHENATTLVEVAASELNGFFLKGQKEVPDFVRHAELFDSFPSVLRKVPCHLEIDVIGRQQTLACPAFLDHGDKFLSDVQAARIIPTILEPAMQLLRGILVEHVDVEFALALKPGHREIATTEVGDDRIDGIGAMSEVELRVQSVFQEQLHLESTRLELLYQTLKSRLIGIGWIPDGKLLAEFRSGVFAKFR